MKFIGWIFVSWKHTATQILKDSVLGPWFTSLSLSSTNASLRLLRLEASMGSKARA